MGKIINLLSDTVTHPTEEMRKAMFEAEVGDDVSNADPTVKRLEKLAAEKVGMEAALFVPSGTMGNLIALLCHTVPGQEVILEETSHIYYYEAGNISRVAGLIPRTIKGVNGIMNPEDVRAAFREENIHFPRTGLICVENTHNNGGGVVLPIETLKEIRNIANEKKVKLHMDGARVFNAAVQLGIDVKEITKHVDSVMFCLSKGLSAPVGSMICGSKEFIYEAVRMRKMLGGGMRQVGVIASAGIVALESMVDRLAEDHKNARILAEGLNKNPYIEINLAASQTNIIMLELKGHPLTGTEIAETLKEKFGILCDKKTDTRIRMVTNRHITADDVQYVIKSVNSLGSV